MMAAFDDQYSQIRLYVEAVVFAALYFRMLRTIPLQARAKGGSAPAWKSGGGVYGSGIGAGKSA